ncbi:MAG: hypothetical protein BYD32DRAFT_120033 [Podila humilis]|nr:MAG: hypothetical protein BYD32DRAFT_120033 [Podila humilis]
MAVATTSKPPSKQEHVNFWADLEKQDTKSSAGNPEREAEAKAKQEKWDRTIAMHLDTGIKGKSPWYLSPHAGSMETSVKRGDDKKFTKVREDPLLTMKAMLDKHEKHRRKRSKSPSRSRRHHRESAQEQKPRQESDGTSTMDRLRKERLVREQAERTRASELLHSPTNYPNERQRGYNQQFNPTATNMAHSNRHTGHFSDTNRYDRGRNDHYSSRGASSTSRDQHRQRPY